MDEDPIVKIMDATVRTLRSGGTTHRIVTPCCRAVSVLAGAMYHCLGCQRTYLTLSDLVRADG